MNKPMLLLIAAAGAATVLADVDIAKREVYVYLGDQILEQEIDGVYLLAGNAPECAYFAVSDLLYRNGARCIHTGEPADGFESGTYLEWMKTLNAPAKRFYQPKIARRTGFALERWPKLKLDKEQMTHINNFAVRNCASPGCFSPMQGGRARQPIGCEAIQPPVNEFNKHPEWFPEIDGKRWRPTGGGWEWVVEGCWMSKGFFDWVVENTETRIRQKGGENKILRIDMATSDGGRKCECAGCRELSASYPDTAFWYWDYQTKVANEMARRHPQMLVEASAYLDGLCYPKLGSKVLQGIQAIVYCPYRRCFIHPYSDKTCPTNKADLDRIAEWKQADVPVGDIQDRLYVKRGQARFGKAPYLSVELVGPHGRPGILWDKSHKPDWQTVSSALVFGFELLEAPCEMELLQSQPGLIFADDEQRETTLRVKANKAGESVLRSEIHDWDGKNVKSFKLELALQAGEERRVPLDLAVGEGWYALDVSLTSQPSTHNLQIVHHATFCDVGKCDRKAGYESPYSFWCYGQHHGATADIDIMGPIYRKLGIRRLSAIQD